MADQEKDKQTQIQIDEMLDSLLASYSSAEPRPGLETRILANLRDAEGREASRGWWSFKWLWAGAALAAIIVAAILISGRQRIEPPTHVAVRITQPVPQPEIQPHAPIAPKETARIHRRKPVSPTLTQNATLALSERPANFPTPVPLSEQERLMLAYLTNTPHQEVIAQIQRTDQQEAAEFWEDRNGFAGKPVNR